MRGTTHELGVRVQPARALGCVDVWTGRLQADIACPKQLRLRHLGRPSSGLAVRPRVLTPPTLPLQPTRPPTHPPTHLHGPSPRSPCSADSDTNLLTTTRGPNDFLGVQLLVDPTVYKKARQKGVPCQHMPATACPRRPLACRAVLCAATLCVGYRQPATLDPILSLTCHVPPSPASPDPRLVPATCIPPPQKLAERWRSVLVARTEVHGALLSRSAVELLLQHYPLAQVGAAGRRSRATRRGVAVAANERRAPVASACRAAPVARGCYLN